MQELLQLYLKLSFIYAEEQKNSTLEFMQVMELSTSFVKLWEKSMKLFDFDDVTTSWDHPKGHAAFNADWLPMYIFMSIRTLSWWVRLPAGPFVARKWATEKKQKVDTTLVQLQCHFELKESKLISRSFRLGSYWDMQSLSNG